MKQMKNKLIAGAALASLAFGLVACGDDSSSSALAVGDDTELSSSSNDDVSSFSVKAESSSSVAKEESSSSAEEVSSSSAEDVVTAVVFGSDNKTGEIC